MGRPQQCSQARNEPARKRHRGPRLPASLRRALQPKETKSDDDEVTEAGPRLSSDIYEYEENVAPEEVGRSSRYDEVDRLEYQLPSDFEDEEIDEETASGEDSSDQLRIRHFRNFKKSSVSAAKRKTKRKFQSKKESKIKGDEAHTADALTSNNSDRLVYPSTFGDDNDDVAEEEAMEEQESLSWEQDSDDSENEANDERHRRMVDAVTKYRAKARRRKKSPDTVTFSEAYPESEFNVNPKDGHTSHQISVEDLMTPLHDKTGFASLRKRMQQLQKRGAPLGAPLPKVVQERLDRQAGYEKSREEISKWQDIVKRNREVPTLFLTKRTDLTPVSTAELASKFEPTTDLEKEVASLLQECEVPNGNQWNTTLELNKLTVGEVKERQERLAKMRSLLFYHEAKAKRIKKIKSKAFHSLQQKDQKMKLRLNGLEDSLDPEAMKEATLKQEFKRAQERMTLKHKNTSKWAKRIIQRGLKAKNDGSRDAIAEQLRIHEALTRKIHSANNASSSDDSSDEVTDSGAGDHDKNASLAMKSGARLLAKSKMETLKVLEGDAEAEIPATGLFSLPFMARAIEKKRKQAHDEALAVLEGLERLENFDNVPDGVVDGFQENFDVPQDIGVPSGRIAFGVMAKPPSLCNGINVEDGVNMQIEDCSSSDDGSEEENTALSVRSNDAVPKKRRERDNHTLRENYADQRFLSLEVLDNSGLQGGERLSSTPSGYLSVEQDCLKSSITNPWLFGDGKEKPFVADHAYGVRLPERDQKKEDSKGLNVQKLSGDNEMQQQRLQETQVTVAGHENGLLSGLGVDVKKDESANKIDIKMRESPFGSSAKPSYVADIEQQNMPGSGGGSDEEYENDGMGKQGFELMTGNDCQAELIQRAFAGDNVEADFEQLKSQALDEEVPKGESPVNLPGWGQWTDVQKRKGKPFWLLQKEEELKSKRKLALRKRKDSNLKHVIISEKSDKKAEKFFAPSLPFPYQSRETFERSIRMPLGREFNPDHAFREMIRPSVVKHAGIIIDPIKYTLSAVRNGRDSLSLPRKKIEGRKKGLQ